MAAAAVATVFNKAFGNRRLWQETKIHPPQKQKLSNCTSTSAAILLCLLCFFSVVCRASDSKQYGVSEGTRMRAIGNKVGFPPELCLLEGRFKAFNFFCGLFSLRQKEKKIFLTLHVGCNLHLFQREYWQAGRREKPQYYTSSCSNFSSLLLKWCCRCCKLETELIMNRVNRSQDPILPGITLKRLCSGIGVQRIKGNPTYLLLESEPILFPRTIVTAGFFIVLVFRF